MGLCWRIDFDAETQDRLRSHVHGKGDLSSNSLELLAMVVPAMAIAVEAKAAPQSISESTLLKSNKWSIDPGGGANQGWAHCDANTGLPTVALHIFW